MAYERDKRLESKDWVVILAGFLGALKILLASLPEPYAIKIPDETVSALVNVIAFGIVLWGVIHGVVVGRKDEQ